MTTLNDYGTLLLGSRLRRLSDQLHAGVDLSYRAAGVEVSSRCFPLLFLLRDNGPTGITALAGQIGQTHPAVVQLSRTLLDAGLVTEQSDPRDERRRLLAVSERGLAMMADLSPIWKDIRVSADQLFGDDAELLLTLLERAETALLARGFADRIAARKRERELAEVTIVDFAPEYAADFKRLNIEWLERYFYVEEVDNQVLSDPQANILDGGGQIFIALLNGKAVGTCALIRADAGRVELSKMSVSEQCQGLGVGRRLLDHALAAFRASGAPLLYLESNSKLTPAIKLYESAGFVHAPPPPGLGHYQRANVYMEWRG